MPPDARPRSNTRLSTLVGLLLLVFAVLYGGSSWNSVKDDQVRQMKTVLEISEKALDSYFVQAEAGMRALALEIDALGGIGNPRESQRALRRYHEQHPEAVEVALLRPDLQMVASSVDERIEGLPSLAGVASLQSYVASLSDTATMRLGRPTTARLDGSWVFPLRHVVRDKSGAIVGHLAVIWPVTMLERFWRSAPVLERTTIGLLRDDAYLLSRFPMPPGRSNAQVYGEARSGALSTYLRQGGFPAEGYVEGHNEQVGALVANAFKRLEHYPVTLFVALPTSAFQAVWWERVRVPYLLLALLATIGLLGSRRTLARERAMDAVRQDAENATRASEEDQRFLIDQLPAGVTVYARDGTVLRRNPRAMALLGLDESSATTPTVFGQGWRFLDEAGRELAFDELVLPQVVRTRQAVRDRILGMIAPGREDVTWLLTNFEPEPDGPNSRGRIVLTFIDITARRQAEIERERSESRYRMVFENSLDALIQSRPDGTILQANPTACALFGTDEATLIARGRGAITDAADPRLHRLIAERARNGRARGEITMMRIDGTRFEGEVSSALYTDRDHITTCSIFVRDVTDRRRVESALAARDLAENANRAKSQFLAHMSHELRTPLNAILGFSDVLQIDPSHTLAPVQLEQVRHIHRAGEHLLSMIDDILDLSRVEAGVLKLSIGDIDPMELIAQTARDVRAGAEADDLRVTVTVEPTVPIGFVRGDPTRFRQVVQNLLSNAVKYNRPGGSASVGLVRTGDTMVLTVRDTGLGMSAGQLAALFQPFDRLGRENSGVQGTGIGLVITRSLVEAMEGRLHVASEEGVGTTFRVELPCLPAEGPVQDATRASAARVPSTAGERCRVLYVDDDPINRLLVEALLKLRPDVELALASSGEEGVAQALALKPDLVLVDMMMPSMDGIDVLREIRSHPALQGTRCIAVSARAMPQEIAEAMDAGFDGYLTKPLPADVLLPEIDRARLAR